MSIVEITTIEIVQIIFHTSYTSKIMMNWCNTVDGKHER